MVLRCAFFHLSRVAEDGNYYRPQRYKDANALYAFKSRGMALLKSNKINIENEGHSAASIEAGQSL